MNLDKKPARWELAALLAQCDDRAAHHVLWVRHDGAVEITPLPPGMMPGVFGERGDLRFRYETSAAGNGYVGRDAAADDDYVGDLFRALVEDWERGTTGYVDDFMLKGRYAKRAATV